MAVYRPGGWGGNFIRLHGGITLNDQETRKGRIGSFQTLPADTTQTSALFPLPGDCIRNEVSTSVLYVTTNEGETVILPPGRTWLTRKGFNSFHISGYAPGETVEISAGYGFIVDPSVSQFFIQGNYA